MTFEIEVGQIVAGKYELLRLLGRGAMGEVWLARHKTLGEEVAVKFLRPQGGEERSAALERFLFEARVAARLSKKSRHIVQVVDHGEESGVAYLVMERLEGESLDERMRRGRLPIGTLKRIVSQVARALAQAHAEGVFHRDLKPANVFLCADDDGKLLVKLLDFGIARAIQKEGGAPGRTTGRGVVLGTPAYMSPEQARGIAQLDHRCDLWALAVVAYEALVGDIPFLGTTTEEIYVSVCTHVVRPIEGSRPELGPEVAAFFERALAADIGRRFQTAEAFAAAFEALSVPDDAPAPAPRIEERSGGATQAKLAVTLAAAPRTRGRAAGALVATALVVGALVGSRLLLRARAPEPAPPPVAATAPPVSAPVVVVPEPLKTAPEPPLVAVTALPSAPPAPPVDPRPVKKAAPAASAPPPPPPPAPTASQPKKRIDKSDVF